jgi:acetyltransferase-like isoleucine patch superfamily enzyme
MGIEMGKVINTLFFISIRLYFGFINRVLSNRFASFLKHSFYYSYLKYFGVETEFGYVKLVGLPIIRRHRNSRIILGKGVTLVSSSHGNVAGVNHPVVLATLAEGAIIHLDRCGLSGSSICAVKSVKIGPNSGLGVNSSVYDTDFHVAENFGRTKQDGVLEAKAEPVKIGENVWVAANVIILKGVTIGDGCVIGAGSVVTNDVPRNTLVCGNPARVVRSISNEKEYG